MCVCVFSAADGEINEQSSPIKRGSESVLEALQHHIDRVRQITRRRNRRRRKQRWRERRSLESDDLEKKGGTERIQRGEESRFYFLVRAGIHNKSLGLSGRG